MSKKITDNDKEITEAFEKMYGRKPGARPLTLDEDRTWRGFRSGYSSGIESCQVEMDDLMGDLEAFTDCIQECDQTIFNLKIAQQAANLTMDQDEVEIEKLKSENKKWKDQADYWESHCNKYEVRCYKLFECVEFVHQYTIDDMVLHATKKCLMEDKV